MTILNVSVTPERVLIASNTAGWRFNKTSAPTSKVIPIPHLNAALAYRGDEPMFLATFVYCASAGASDFDALADLMPDLLQAAHAQTKQYGATFFGKAEVNYQILLAGWSGKRHGPFGYLFQKEGGSELVRNEIDEFVIMPGDGMRIENPDTDDKMIALARAQSRYLAELESEPGAGAGGGRLIAVEIERDRMTVRTLCEL